MSNAMILDQKLSELINLYCQNEVEGNFGKNEHEKNFRESIENRRNWMRENILDVKKLTEYSDEDFKEKILDLFNYVEGTERTQARARGVFLKQVDNDPMIIRTKFENLIKLLNDKNVDKFTLLEKVTGDNSPYRVPGIGHNTLTSLINAQYPEVPIINGTTIFFFNAIGQGLSNKESEQQKEVYEFFKHMLDLTDRDVTFDDMSHVCWFARTTDAGKEFMEREFKIDYDKVATTIAKKPRAKKLSPEEERAELIRHLQEIQNRSRANEN